MSNWVEFTVAASGLATGLLAFLTGWLRERQTTERYRIYADAQAARDRALSQATAEGRQAIEAEPPISQPPSLGPLMLAAVAVGGLGVSTAGAGAIALAPRQQPEHGAPSSPQCKSCDPPCPRGQYCSGGQCVSNAETPEGAAAALEGQRGGFMPLPGWVDRSASPFDRDPALYRQ